MDGPPALLRKSPLHDMGLLWPGDRPAAKPQRPNRIIHSGEKQKRRCNRSAF
jgi:hypothetical protein